MFFFHKVKFGVYDYENNNSIFEKAMYKEMVKHY